MGWFVLGSVRHGRNRNLNSFFHFGRFWCASSPSSSELDDSLLGFERFSHQCWSWRTFCTLIFAPPRPFQTQCWTSSAKTVRTEFQNQHWWGRGRRNRWNFRIFDSIYSLSYCAYVLLDFTDPKKNQPILDQPRRVFWYVLTLDFLVKFPKDFQIFGWTFKTFLKGWQITKFKILILKTLANHEIQNARKRLAKIHWDLSVPTTVLLRLKVSDNRFDDRYDRFAPT